MIYVGRVWLCYTEEELWNMRPRMFFSQLEVHHEIQDKMYGGNKNGRSISRQPNGFIDQIQGW